MPSQTTPTAFERDAFAFHFTWNSDPVAVARAVRSVEEALAPSYGTP